MIKLIIFFRLLLFPLSLIFYIIIYIRNLFYDKNILKQISFPVKIISVGNITTGGTGKTPFVIYLVDYFLNHNKKVGIISRGYKNDTSDMIIAFDGNDVLADVNSAGDELYMIINRFSEHKDRFFAIAYKNRIDAIDEMVSKYKPDIIILDDAFQNRKIKKSVDIVINDKNSNTILDSIILPSGNLREPYSSLGRADLVFDNYKFNNISNEISNPLFFSYKSIGLFNVNGTEIQIGSLNDVMLISGIAKNESFSNYVCNFNLNIRKSFFYIDHYKYTSKDIEVFEKNYKSGCVFITTEKDFVKLKGFKNFVDNFPVYYLRIDVNLNNDYLNNFFRKAEII